MYVQYASDLHLEGYGEKHCFIPIDKIINSRGSSELLILAGDIANVARNEHLYRKALDALSLHYRGIIAVAGNHEYYGGDIPSVKQILKHLQADYDKFIFLDNEMISFEGLKVYGGSLWYPFDPDAYLYRECMNDDNQIKSLEGKDYDEYHRFKKNLIKYCDEFGIPDIVISHHLPSYDCVDVKYIGSPLNRFFVGSCDELIEEYGFRYWIHGHTHERVNLYKGLTKVLCNPSGYWKYDGKNFDPGAYFLIQ